MESFFLGLLQGLTEFLPVSSSGHLVLFQNLIKTGQKKDILLEVVVHGGTLLSILTFFSQSLKEKFYWNTKNFHFWKTILIANIATALLVLPLQSFFESFFFKKDLIFLGVCFFLTGVFLWPTRKSKKQIKPITLKKAFLIGCVQGLAVLPGLSRSGLTICTGLSLQMSRKESSFFSFAIAIPALLGALILKSFQVETNVLFSLPILIAFATSYLIGLMALKLLVSFVESNRLHIFSFYLWPLGAYLIIKSIVI